MLLLAILGVAVNGLAYSRLHAGHSHNVEVVRLHLLEDVLGWIIVLLGAIAIELWSLYILDPILSLAVSAWILYQVIRRLKKSIRIILQNTPSGITIQEVDRLIRAIPGIQTTHDTHLWTMDGDYHILTVHAVLQSQLSMAELARLKETIRQKLNTVHIKHATIEFEYPDESCVLAEC
jgi:cobalt-zinc-cadmium efflux system protein